MIGEVPMGDGKALSRQLRVDADRVQAWREEFRPSRVPLARWAERHEHRTPREAYARAAQLVAADP
jgi:hypothetical protein